MRKLFSTMLACAITMTLAPVTAHAEGEDADAGYNVTIQYDELTNIHSVTKNDRTVILYCLQDKRHWPHTIQGSVEKVPMYKEITFDDFCAKNELTDNTKINTLAEEMRRVLFAGYNYNGLDLYSSDKIVPITEEEFDKLLSLPADDPLRSDFPDSLGDNYQFTYANRNDDVQKKRIELFAKEARTRIENHYTSKSGMLASELAIQPFYQAAFNLYNYSWDPLGALSAWNTAYNATSYAVWSLAGNAGIADSDNLAVVGLGKKILGAADNPDASILKEEPKVTPVLTQNAVFTYKDEDKKWHLSPITLLAAGISTRFTVTVSGDGKAVNSSGNEVTEIKPGDSFSLVSDKEPSDDTKVSVSSSVPWMVGDLVVYEPDPNVKTSDGKGFQNMVGVVINHKDLNAVATVRKVEDTTSLTFTKKWVDDNNASGKRPDASSYAKSLTLLADGEEQSGYEAEVTDNGDNTYTVSYKGLPKLVDGKVVKYSVKEATVEGYNSDSSDVSDGGTLVNTLIVPTPSPTATATVSTPAPTATVTVTENKPVRSVSPTVVKPVPPTGVESSYGENGH